MFNNLTNFSYKRNWKEAIGFYLAYMLLALILGIILVIIFVPAVLSGTITINNYTNYAPLTEFASYFSCIYCAIISALLLAQKRLLKNLGYVLLALLGIFLGVSSGLFFGLIIPAYMTTRRR